MKLADKIAASVVASVRESEKNQKKQEKLSAVITASVKKALTAEEDPFAAPVSPAMAKVEGDKVQYYIERACEELSNRLRDVRFETNEAFNSARCTITNVTTSDKNVTTVSLQKVLRVNPTSETRSEVNNILNKLRELSIPKKFADYINLTYAAGEDGTSIVLNINFVLPAEYMDVIGADDFMKRNAIVSKEIKKIVDQYLCE